MKELSDAKIRIAELELAHENYISLVKELKERIAEMEYESKIADNFYQVTVEQRNTAWKRISELEEQNEKKNTNV